MELNHLSFNPRSRTSYEIFDLALLLTKRHFMALFAIYLSLVLPLFLILGLVLGWSWGALIAWWLKPVFERPLLDYLSKVIFNQQASIRSSIGSIFKLSVVDFCSHLTILRLSPNRAFLAPVEQLENLSGQRKKARKLLLFSSNKPKQSLWMLFCVHFELILVFSIAALIIALTPGSFSLQEQYYQFQSDPTWVEVSFNFIYIFVIALIAPLFVTGGFLAYLHRRVELEGWDIELAFKNMRSRFKAILPVLCFFVSALFLAPSPKTYAQELNKETIKNDVAALYAENDVIEKKTTWVPHFDESDGSSEKDFLSSVVSFFQWIGTGLGNLSWLLVGGLVLLLAYYLYKNKGFFTSVAPNDKVTKNSEHVIPTLFADIQHNDIPKDLILAAKQAYEEGNLRRALAYLLQFSLFWAQEAHSVKLHYSMTESECQFAIYQKIPPSQQPIFERLFLTWMKVAWAHQHIDFNFAELSSEVSSLKNARLNEQGPNL